MMGTLAFPLDGGTPIRLSHQNWTTQWTADMRQISISVYSTGLDSWATGRTYVLPLAPGQALPKVGPDGFNAESDIAGFPGARLINCGDVRLGASSDTYAFSVGSVQRNLYRIPLADRP